MNWFTSDLHLGDPWATKLRYCGDDIEKHNNWLATRWDANIRPSDHVYILGDFVAGASFEYAQSWLGARPGTKHLIIGNNDEELSKSLDVWISMGFSSARTFGEIFLGDGIRVTMSHYPDAKNAGSIHLHGHTHKKQKIQVDDTIKLHVGWDAWRRYTPEEDLIALIMAI